MDRLNIAFYTDSYLPGTDGVVTSIVNFKKGLEKKGHRVYIFASSNMQGARRIREKNVFFYQGIEFKPYPQYSVALFPYNSMLKVKGLGIDIVHSQTPFMMGFAGLISAKMLRLPLVGSFHTMIIGNKPIRDYYYPKNGGLRRIAERSMKGYISYFYGKCDVVISPSETVKNILAKYRVRNSVVVPNSVDMERFNPMVRGGAVREELGIEDGQKVVLSLGRMSREKKIEVLLKAAKEITKKRRDVVFVIGGTGPAEGYYRNLAEKLHLGNRVRFLGYVSKERLPHVYAAADMFCMPSTFETQGIVLLEAMALGKPAVGADYMAINDIIKDGVNGERFMHDNYHDCARKIGKVLNNCAAYRNGAIETARKFSIDRLTEQLIKAYKIALD